MNEYVLTSELGRGAFGVVWLAFRRASTPSDVFVRLHFSSRSAEFYDSERTSRQLVMMMFTSEFLSFFLFLL